MYEINAKDIETVMILIDKLYEKEKVSADEYNYMQIVLDCCLPLAQHVSE